MAKPWEGEGMKRAPAQPYGVMRRGRVPTPFLILKTNLAENQPNPLTRDAEREPPAAKETKRPRGFHTKRTLASSLSSFGVAPELVETA